MDIPLSPARSRRSAGLKEPGLRGNRGLRRRGSVKNAHLPTSPSRKLILGKSEN